MHDLNRRELIGAMAMLGLAGMLPGAAFAKAGSGFGWPLGLQLYSVNAQLDQDLEGTLAKLAQLGYQQVESAGLHGRTPDAFRRAVAGAGLQLVSAHMSMQDLLDDPAGKVAIARDMGVRWLICSSPKPDRPMAPGEAWIPGIMHAMTLDAWKKNADALGQIGALAKQQGIGFGYHNHPVEFARYDGERGIDVLMSRTDPALVKFELDVAWAVAGGVDPAAFIDAHRDRIRLLHLKGIKTKPPLGQMAESFDSTELQAGAVDWPRLLAAAKRAGVESCFVEQEPPYTRPIFESLAISRDYLRSL